MHSSSKQNGLEGGWQTFPRSWGPDTGKEERTQLDPGGTPQPLEVPPGKKQVSTDLWRNRLPQMVMSSGTSTGNYHTKQSSTAMENTDISCKFLSLCIILGVSFLWLHIFFLKSLWASCFSLVTDFLTSWNFLSRQPWNNVFSTTNWHSIFVMFL